MSDRMTPARLAAVTADLSERDMAIIDAVGQLRLARATHLERLFFVDLAESSRGRRRRDVLARLRRADLLSSLHRRIGGVRAGSSGEIVRLGLVGQHVYRRHDPTSGRARRLPEPSIQFQDHTLAIAEVYTQLHETRLDLESIQTEPDCWRLLGLPGGGTQTLKPDLYVELALDDFVYEWFIEVDLGTEGPTALRRKAERYVRAYRTLGGDSFPRVLWLVPNERRAERLDAVMLSVGGPDGLWAIGVMGSSMSLRTLVVQADSEAA